MVLGIGALAGDAVARPGGAGLSPDRSLRTFALTSWSSDDGLPTNALTNVLQTSDGYLWIATFNGLARFDGKSFTVFNTRTLPILRSDGFHELVEDRDGNLWIGTQSGGLLVYRDGVFESPLGGEDGRLTIRAILVDDAGGIWLGTGDFGAYRLRGGVLTPVDHPAVRDVTVRDLYQDRSGAIWFATEGKGLVRLAGGRFTVWTSASGLAGDAVTSLAETDAAGGAIIWVGGQDGLSLIGPDGARSVPDFAGIEIFRLRGDDHGSLWLATEQGLFRRAARSGELEQLKDPAGRPLRSISALTLDREGSMWVASYLDGLFQLRPGKFVNYVPGSAGGRVNVIAEVAPGEFWAGIDGGRIVAVRGGETRPLELPVSLPDVRVRGILYDRAGRLWISSYAGLLRIEDGGHRLYDAAGGLPTNQIRFAFEDRAGRIWAATRNAGLLRWQGGDRFTTIDRTAGLTSDFVLSLEEGPRGALYVGTHEGLTILRDDGPTERYTIEDGLPGGIVFSTSADAAGALWLCTNAGLARLEDGKIGSITSDHGLPTESIFDYREDALGFVWLSSSVGALRIAKEQLVAVAEGRRKEVETTLYDHRDGMVSRECTGAAKILESSTGELWFPTLSGISVIDPARITTNPVPPPVEISRLLVDGEPIAPPFDPERVIELGPGSKEYQFEFAALSLLAPSKVEVRYRLEGFDDDWVDSGPERRVRFTSLPPGSYAFRVIAANNDGLWNEEGATLRFRIRPFFYQHPLFLLMAALAAAGGVRGVYAWRIRTERARNRELERVIAEQKKIQQELEARNEEMERFAYTVSHDLKSPLVTIKGFLGFLTRDVRSGQLDRLEHNVGRINEAADRMRRLLDELIELSRIGRVVNPSQPVALDEVVREAVELLAGPIAERGVEVVVGPDLPILFGDRTRLLELIQNLIENAVRYLGEASSPRIEVGCRGVESGMARCWVRDNGIGIEPAYHQKIFGLFERLDPEGEGTGIGLALVRRIVEIHGGEVWVESEGLGRGSTFYFTLPVKDD